MLRRSYYRRGGKYSNETIAFNSQVTSPIDANVTWPKDLNPSEEEIKPYSGITIVAPSNVLGNRKVKNFTIKVTSYVNDDPIFGALVYVPEGTFASDLTVGKDASSLYEPNQNVIATFMIPPNCTRETETLAVKEYGNSTQIVVQNRLARNLNTGDKIVLIFATPNGLSATMAEPVYISGTVNFAIKY